MSRQRRRSLKSLEKPIWLLSLLSASIISMLFGLFHVSDAIVREEIGNVFYESLDATMNVFYAVVYLFGIALSWNQKRQGYVIVAALSALSSWGFFAHATGITPPNIVEIGKTSGVFFVFVILMGAVAAVSALLLGIYGLARRVR